MKRICVFLLLGILLFSIVLSGCSQKEETEASGQDMMYVLDQSDINGLRAVCISESLDNSSLPVLNEENGRVLFQEFFEGIPITKDSARVSFVEENFPLNPLQLTYNCDENLHICFYGDGTLLVYIHDEIFVSTEDGVVDVEAIKKRIDELEV